MKLILKRKVVKIVEETVEDNFIVIPSYVKRRRKNQVDGFSTCDYCLKKIDTDGEKQINFICKESIIMYSFHEVCATLATGGRNELWNQDKLQDKP